MDKKVSHLIAFFLCSILLIVLFSGCITEEQTSETITEMVHQKLNWTNLRFFQIGTMENTTITLAQQKC